MPSTKSSISGENGCADFNRKQFSGFLSMQVTYPYVEINGQYFYLKQNILELAWFLFFGSKPLKQHSTFKIKRLASTLKTFIRFRLGLKKGIELKKFPVCCNLIFKVHGGYRAFDFKHKTVTKIISDNFRPADAIAEIDGVRKANQLDFAPNLLRWNAAEHWYEEEYIDGVVGYSGLNSDARMISKLFNEEIVHCLGKMILFNPPVKTTVNEVVNRCSKSWDYDRLSRITVEPGKLDGLYQFVQLKASKLLARADQTIYLIFSHGDFSLRNMLMTKSGIKILDWETITNRSVLFDLYNFFLTELYYHRASTDLTSEIKKAIIILQAKLNSKNPEVAHHLLACAEVYRWLYYVERICMLLQRGLNDKTLEVVNRSIKIFSEFEQKIIGLQ